MRILNENTYYLSRAPLCSKDVLRIFPESFKVIPLGTEGDPLFEYVFFFMFHKKKSNNMINKLLSQGYKKYSNSCDLYLKSDVKKRSWILNIIDFIVQFIIGTFLRYEYIFSVELKYCGIRKFLFWRRVCFSFSIMSGEQTVYHYPFTTLNISNVWSMIQGIWAHFSEGRSLDHML